MAVDAIDAIEEKRYATYNIKYSDVGNVFIIRLQELGRQLPSLANNIYTIIQSLRPRSMIHSHFTKGAFMRCCFGPRHRVVTRALMPNSDH